MKRFIFGGLAIAWLLVAATTVRAVNDSLWMGFRYSIAVKYLDGGGVGVDSPRPKTMEMPDYPIEPMRAAVSGTVLVSFIVAEDGSVREVQIEEAHSPDFGAAAKKAVAQWKFLPGTVRRTGKIVSAPMRCRFEFRADEDEPTRHP